MEDSRELQLPTEEFEQGPSQRERQEYLEFIKVTRRHQAERERLKKLELKKNPPSEEYYVDLSQLSTLALDNPVEAPKRGQDDEPSSFVTREAREKQFIELYGSKEAYEKIRSLEMHIDDHFKSKCRDIKPFYWPVIPINPKPYLNPIRDP